MNLRNGINLTKEVSRLMKHSKIPAHAYRAILNTNEPTGDSAPSPINNSCCSSKEATTNSYELSLNNNSLYITVGVISMAVLIGYRLGKPQKNIEPHYPIMRSVIMLLLSKIKA